MAAVNGDRNLLVADFRDTIRECLRHHA